MDDDYFGGFPSVHDLFIQYNDQYFHGKLVEAAVSVEWSSRMTLCAGLCYYERRTKSCRIKLSEALLKFRPFSDTVNTLLVSAPRTFYKYAINEVFPVSMK